MEASVRDFKARLSLFLRRLEDGEDVVITSRGRPIARLLALVPDDAHADVSELLRRLRQIPGMLPGKGGRIRGASRPLLIGPGQKTLAELVLEDRR